MNYRRLGKTGFDISEISLGTWQVGGRWGERFNKENARGIINQAIDAGINFIDTADVYGSGLSEKMVGEVVRQRSERVFVASKCGRRLNPHNNEAYTTKALRLFVEQSLRNSGLDSLDLIQLHCPPPEVYGRPEIFGLFEDLKAEGKILNMGVSVETVDEARKAINYDNVTSIQIIFNMFRLKPAETFFEEAEAKNVGIIVRVPLASGLLSGKYSSSTVFGKEDHRSFNRDGAAFDKGETFSGVDYETGLQAVEAIKALFPDQENLAALALRWILMFKQVSCVIPGASKGSQLVSNLEAAGLDNISAEQMDGVEEIYNRFIKDQVHQLW